MRKSDRKYLDSKKGVLNTIYRNQKTKERRKGIKVNYTYNEFKERYLSSDEFLEIYNFWYNNGKQKKLKPSFDRIDCKDSYNFENLKIVTWIENNQKGVKERKKTVNMFCKNNKTFLKQFNSLKDCEEYIGIKNSSKNIGNCCRKRLKSAYGYYWEYAKE